MYFPSSTLLFGMNKGYTLAEVYQFEPHYLEWLIKAIPSFFIEIHSFLQLPDPTPFDRYGKNNTDNSAIEYKSDPNKIDFTRMRDVFPNKSYGDSSLKAAKDFLKRGGRIQPVKYQFPPEIIEINKQKTLGEYAPHANPDAKYNKDYYALIAKDFICKN